MKKNTAKVIIFICLTALAITGVIFTKHFFDAALLLIIATYCMFKKDED